MVNTSHAALYSIAAMIASTGLSSICGHAVDITNIDYGALIVASVAMFADMKKRWNQIPTGVTVAK